MGYYLFVLLNAILLIRPEELLPEIAGLRLYLIVICLCLLTSGHRILALLQPAELANRPITVCVLGLLAAVVVSNLVRGRLDLVSNYGGEFGKVVLYYLLLVATIDTPERMRGFLAWIVGFVSALAALALLQYHHVIDIEALTALERRQYDPETGDVIYMPQLRASGIYNDPNDLCLILVTGSICALYRAATTSTLVGSAAWLAPVGVFGYALVLTKSRGGMLGLLVALLVWSYGYFGRKKTLFGALVLLPVMVALAGGSRQADINLDQDDTAYARLTHWSDGLVALMRNPVTGIGAGEYVEVASGHVAHNSFIHTFVETGLFGGTLFLGAFYLAVLGLRSADPEREQDPTLARLTPFVLAIVVGYAGGVFSLSRGYVVPTYLVIGLAAAYLRMAHPTPPPEMRLDGRMAVRLLGIGLVGLIGLKVFTQGMLMVAGR
jgi:hypothetical protein